MNQIQSLFFLAQLQAAGDKGTGMILFFVAIGCVALIGFGAFSIAHNQNLTGIGFLLAAVVFAVCGVPIVNFLFGTVAGAGGIHLNPGGVNTIIFLWR